jgi:hypothetical protein
MNKILGTEVQIERSTENKFHEYNSDLDTIRMLQESLRSYIHRNKMLETRVDELEKLLTGGWVIGSGSDLYKMRSKDVT